MRYIPAHSPLLVGNQLRFLFLFIKISTNFLIFPHSYIKSSICALLHFAFLNLVITLGNHSIWVYRDLPQSMYIYNVLKSWLLIIFFLSFFVRSLTCCLYPLNCFLFKVICVYRLCIYTKSSVSLTKS